MRINKVNASTMNESNPDRVPIVAELIARRDKDNILQRAVAVAPEADHEALLHQIDDLVRRLDALIEATQKVREPLSFDVLLTRLMTLITEAFDADRSSLFLYDAETRELYSRVAQGDLIKEIRFPCDAGIAGHVFADIGAGTRDWPVNSLAAGSGSTTCYADRGGRDRQDAASHGGGAEPD